MERRQLHDEDVDEVLALWNDAVSGEEGHDRDRLDADDLGAFRNSEHYSPAATLVAEDEGDLCGVAAGYREHARTGETTDGPAHLAGIAVDPDRWREGIGQALLGGVEDALRAAGASTITFHLLRQPTRLASGPSLDTGAYRFLVSQGYQPHEHAMYLRNDLDRFELPDEIRQRRERLEAEGITFKHAERGERESLLALLDEQFSTGWHDRFERATAEDDSPAIPIVKAEGEVIGFMGPCWIDADTGRGSIGTPGLDSAYRGRGIGKTRFFLGLQYLKEVGATFTEYRTGYDPMGADAATEMYFDSGARLVEIVGKDLRKPLE